MITNATDLPDLRAEAERFLRAFGLRTIREFLADGTSFPVFEFHRYTMQAIAQAELFFVADVMTRLAMAAGQSLQGDFNIHLDDLPSDSGLVVFERPIFEAKGQSHQFPIAAALWHLLPGERIAIIWLTDRRHEDFRQPTATGESITSGEVRERGMARFVPGGYQFVGIDGLMRPTQLIGSRSPAPTDLSMYQVCASVLKSVWLLMGQTLATVEDAAYPRAIRRRLLREDIEPKRVRVISLRRQSVHGDDSRPAEREWHHQWVVRGHWRQQWIPSRNAHRPTWIAPHIKGPEGAPLLGGEKVYALKR